MGVYREAVRSIDKKSYEPALARLEALLLTNPVTVTIDQSSVPQDAAELGDALPESLGIWSDALADTPFQGSVSDRRAQVTVKFVREMRDLPMAQGDLQAQRDFYWSRVDHSYKLNATIRVVYRTGRRFISEEEASGIIAHELGHLIGLDDAVQYDGLMGYFVPGRPKRRVEPEEVEAAQGFRRMVRDKIDGVKSVATR